MKITTYVYAYYVEWEKDFHYTISPCDSMETEGWTKVKTVEIDFDPLTREQLIPPMVAALREKMKGIDAKAHQDKLEVESLINDLLCIEDKSCKVVEEDDISF